MEKKIRTHIESGKFKHETYKKTDLVIHGSDVVIDTCEFINSRILLTPGSNVVIDSCTFTFGK